MDASADELNDEFGASPLGKGPPGDGGSQPSLWPAVGRLPPLAGGAAEDVAPDIYSDLFGAGGEGSTLLKSQLVQAQHQAAQQGERVTELEGTVAALAQQVADLQARCGTLTTNISSLYNTAKLEIQRKDAAIKELRDRLAATGTAATGTRPTGASYHPQQAHPPQQRSDAKQEQVPRDDRQRETGGHGREHQQHQNRSASRGREDRRDEVRNGRTSGGRDGPRESSAPRR